MSKLWDKVEDHLVFRLDTFKNATSVIPRKETF